MKPETKKQRAAREAQEKRRRERTARAIEEARRMRKAMAIRQAIRAVQRAIDTPLPVGRRKPPRLWPRKGK